MAWLNSLAVSLLVFVASLLGLGSTTSHPNVSVSHPSPITSTSSTETQSFSTTSPQWWPLSSHGGDFRICGSLVCDYTNRPLIPPANAAGFIVTTDGFYGTDGTYVYISSYATLPEADPATFEEILFRGHRSDYARDKSHVYYNLGGKIVPDADPNSFVVLDLDGTYAKDDQHVWEYGILIPNADPKTVVVYADANGRLIDTVAKDAHEVYVDLPGVDAASFTPLFNNARGTNGDTGYYKDKSRVYFDGADQIGFRVVQDADAATFHVITPTTTSPTFDAEDVYHHFLRGSVVR